MIELDGVGKAFGSVKVLEDVSLSIPEGRFFCLLGPSGCGKTTLLRLVAGLESPDAGSIRVAGKDVTRLAPHLRECAMVFQNYALWPHLSVGENIVYGLEVKGRPRAEIDRALEELLQAYQLQGLGKRFPHQLSGGQQQRVALARAMAMRPRALLMDEPLSNLDAALRKTLRRELLEFHRRAGNTILYVTHDQEEALALSDRIALLMDGRVLESGEPRALYERPQRLETALFLGDMNVFRGGGSPGAPLPAAAPPGKSILCIRPEHVRFHRRRPGENGDQGILEGTLAFTEFMGTHFTLAAATGAGQVLARLPLPEAEGLEPGQTLWLEFPAEHRLWY